jgi:hypothetical protein
MWALLAANNLRRELPARAVMTLIINNDDVAKLLTIEVTMDALEQSYRNLAIGEAICRPRIDIRTPTSDLRRTTSSAQWKEAPPKDTSRFG